MEYDTRAQKLNNIIEAGKVRVPDVLQEIQTEFDKRQDIIAKPEGLLFSVGKDISTHIRRTDLSGEITEQMGMTHFARNQLLSKTGIPAQFADRLIEMGETTLLENNLNIMNNRLNEDGLLLRHIDNKIKGVLSPSYRRMDGAPIIGGFVEAALRAGYVPYTGTVTDYRYNICFILPEIYQPSENEFLVMGIAITTGDYGSCALQIELVALRISCLNLMIGTDVMRSIHIGKRFNAEESIVILSEKTNELDNKTVASGVSDAVKTSIDLQTGVKNKIKEAAESTVEININEEIAKMRKKGFSKDLAESVKLNYEAPLPVEMLPQSKNLWRLSNAMSLIANYQGTPKDVSLDLQKQAMAIL